MEDEALHQETNDCIAETWATWGEGVRECPECDQVLDPEATHCPTCSGSDYADDAELDNGTL
jgi:Zn finger protein HypA/HybF involved in hydrogenase expression